MPESPRWLCLKGRNEEARIDLAALRDLPTDSPEINQEMQEMIIA